MKTRLDKIQEVIEEALMLKWEDRLVKNIRFGTYGSACEFDFYPNRSTYVHLVDKKGKTYLARVIIGEDKFNISINGMKVDASAHWKELNQEQIVIATTK